MSKTVTQKELTEKLVLTAIFTALVIVLQLLGAFIRFGIFSVSLVLVPIIIGAALCGWKSGAWLGFVFSVAVILSGDATAFFAINVPGTIITVILKGTLCGLVAGLLYKGFKKFGDFAAAFISAIAAPIVNTGIFLLGCSIFFIGEISKWGAAAGFKNTVSYMLLGLAGGNFLFELITNIILVPVIIKVLNLVKKHN